MDEVSMRWEITSPGSADLLWTIGHSAVQVHTTYVGNGLGSLLQAAIDLTTGSSSAIAFLPAEPGGTCLFFTAASTTAYVQVVAFADMRSAGKRWSGGSLQWEEMIDVNQFVRDVTQLAERVFTQYENIADYAKAWAGIPFPLQRLDTLRQYTAGQGDQPPTATSSA